MDWVELVRALALVMVIEGLIPFAAPERWRMAMLQAIKLDARVLRMIGLLSMACGIIVLQLA